MKGASHGQALGVHVDKLFFAVIGFQHPHLRIGRDDLPAIGAGGGIALTEFQKTIAADHGIEKMDFLAVVKPCCLLLFHNLIVLKLCNMHH